jgi:putative heme-binding domain-containing protein
MSKQLYWPIAGFVLITGPLFAQLDRAGLPNTSNPLAQNSARVEAGSVRFRQLCTSCHGRNGEGGQGEGQGPNLATSWEVRRAKDREIFGFIRNGVKGTAMPAFSLPDEQIWELAAFVRSLNAPAARLPVQGDVSAGETVYFGKGECAVCHMIRGRGGYLGPDLSNIGATRRLSELREAVIDPSATPNPEFRPVLLRDSAGHQLRAVAKHLSPWSAQILDEHGNLHLIHGEAVQKLTFQNKSWMPADIAKRLSPDEITNLIAFLSRQSIRPASETGPSGPPSKGDVN